MQNKTIYPSKLHRGSHLRVIAPSRSGAILSADTIARATKRLNDTGFTVTFGRHWQEMDDDYCAASIEARLEDLHDAFADPSVDGILTAIGGYNSNQLLRHIDYNLIRQNPKIFCGYSDITMLCNAIFAKTDVATYYGPHFSSWGMRKGFEYSVKAMQDSLMADKSYTIRASESWSDDPWFLDQDNRTFESNDDGNIILRPGKAEGILAGGHLSTFLRLSTTPYCPKLADTILCVEENMLTDFRIFDANLQALLLRDDFKGVRGILIGRFEKSSHMTTALLRQIIVSKPELRHIPVIANVNFGHTMPIAILPIGGDCQIDATSKRATITVTKH